jgi:hypothetical protein
MNDLKVSMWPIDRPIPYARNSRKIPERAIYKVAASIKEFGWRQSIVVDKDDVIICGHTRLLAAKKLGYRQVIRDSFVQKFEVTVTGDSSSPEVVLDDEYRNSGVLGNHDGPDNSWLNKDHVIAFSADATKALGLEDSDQLFIRNRTKLWHASAEAGESRAVR